MSKLTVKNIEKTIGDTKILEDVQFEVEEGTVVSILGPSGCGKTTTLKIIAGLVNPDKGEILLGNERITHLPAEKRGCVIVFQEYLLFPHLNVEENIGFGLKMARQPKALIKAQVENMLKLVKLTGTNKKYPHQLSGGQQQRIALARALAVKPRVLLLDEPFSSLDAKLREEMRELTLHIQRDLHITTVLVTHDKEEALMSSDKIAIMLEGKIKQFGSPEELYHKPNSIEVANFLGEKNYISGKIEQGQFISDLLQFPTSNRDAAEATVMLKPEDIKLFSAGTPGLEGVVLSSKFAGERIYYRVLVNGMELKVTSSPEAAFKKGNRVAVKLALDKPLIFM